MTGRISARKALGPILWPAVIPETVFTAWLSTAFHLNRTDPKESYFPLPLTCRRSLGIRKSDKTNESSSLGRIFETAYLLCVAIVLVQVVLVFTTRIHRQVLEGFVACMVTFVKGC